MGPGEIDMMLRPLNQKDLRIQCRARGLNPGGSKEALAEILKEDMLSSRDFSLKAENGADMVTVNVTAGMASEDQTDGGKTGNNYSRAGGQNVGNFVTDRNSSRVLAPPGGGSQIVFGDDRSSAPTKTAPAASAAAPAANISNIGDNGVNGNNYGRPGGQNVGNFMTNRNSSRVLAPPGGASTITFG
jgi:SPIRAL1-like protein